MSKNSPYSKYTKALASQISRENNATVLDAIDPYLQEDISLNDTRYIRVPKGTLGKVNNDATGYTTSLGLGNAVLVEESDPVTEGLVWVHENDHVTNRYNGMQRLDPDPRFTNIVDNAKGNTANWLSNIRQRHEMASRYKEIEAIQDMIDAGYKGEELVKRTQDLWKAFTLFGESYGKTYDDYNQTKVDNVINMYKGTKR